MEEFGESDVEAKPKRDRGVKWAGGSGNLADGQREGRKWGRARCAGATEESACFIEKLSGWDEVLRIWDSGMEKFGHLCGGK